MKALISTIAAVTENGENLFMLSLIPSDLVQKCQNAKYFKSKTNKKE